MAEQAGSQLVTSVLAVLGCASGAIGAAGEMAGSGCFSRASTSLLSRSAASVLTPGCCAELLLGGGATSCCGAAAALIEGAALLSCCSALAGAPTDCVETSARQVVTTYQASLVDMAESLAAGVLHRMQRWLTWWQVWRRQRWTDQSCRAAEQGCACQMQQRSVIGGAASLTQRILTHAR